jgi:hypothetical protein
MRSFFIAVAISMAVIVTSLLTRIADGTVSSPWADFTWYELAKYCAVPLLALIALIVVIRAFATGQVKGNVQGEDAGVWFRADGPKEYSRA